MGEEGEICIKGHNIMKGYLNNPADTESAFWKDGWFRSGDIGILDEKGYLFIVDRLKDLIITGGENVYPREVEEALYAMPQIRGVRGSRYARQGMGGTGGCLYRPEGKGHFLNVRT